MDFKIIFQIKDFLMVGRGVSIEEWETFGWWLNIAYASLQTIEQFWANMNDTMIAKCNIYFLTSFL